LLAVVWHARCGSLRRVPRTRQWRKQHDADKPPGFCITPLEQVLELVWDGRDAVRAFRPVVVKVVEDQTVDDGSGTDNRRHVRHFLGLSGVMTER
jgi:hypothetical protein